MKTEKIGAGDFKAHCLRYLDEVNSKHKVIVITKRGKVVAKLVPASDEKSLTSLYGCLKGTVIIKEDIVCPIEENWDVNS